MTLIFVWFSMMADFPVILFLASMVCDTILLAIAMLTGIIHLPQGCVR